MTTVTVYRSTDASAPVLTGQVGTLLTVLDAVLVNGYGSQTQAGWTKPFVNSGNIGCYRNSAVDGTGFCLNVNDAGPGAGGAKEARMTGFQTMSALSTGTGQFPTVGQVGIGIGALVCRKSTTADATARAWTIVADDTVFYFFAETGDSVSPTITFPFVFGDIFSYKTSDAYRCIIVGRNAENTAAANQEPLSTLANSAPSALTYVIIGHYMASNWTGVGTSLPVGKHIDMLKMGANQGAAASGTTGGANLPNFGNANICAIGRTLSGQTGTPMPYPNGPDGGLELCPIWVHHNGFLRGYFKGLWAPLHDRPLNHNDTFSGTGNLAGKSFVVQSILADDISAGTAAGQIHIETSSTWS